MISSLPLWYILEMYFIWICVWVGFAVGGGGVWVLEFSYFLKPSCPEEWGRNSMNRNQMVQEVDDGERWDKYLETRKTGYCRY